jgi:hypothetical protein
VRLLDECEGVIAGGALAFVAVGAALLAVSEQHLYLAHGYRTFAEYAARRWGMSSGCAYRKIAAARVIEILRTQGEECLPANEAQVRELLPLARDPEALRRAWDEIRRDHSSEITAIRMREQVKRHRVAARD